ncbi:MAG: hypothetical protein ACXQS5_01460 [Candidatus Methanospirareceae archaeon]
MIVVCPHCKGSLKYEKLKPLDVKWDILATICFVLLRCPKCHKFFYIEDRFDKGKVVETKPCSS